MRRGRCVHGKGRRSRGGGRKCELAKPGKNEQGGKNKSKRVTDPGEKICDEGSRFSLQATRTLDIALR